MVGKILTAYPEGLDGKIITVECDTANGIPGTSIIGMASKSTDEAKERVKSAISNSQLKYPRKKLTLNLAPADIVKSGSGFDLAMAIAILVADGQIPQDKTANVVFAGELSLDGRVKALQNIFPYMIAAQDKGVHRIILPEANLAQAKLVTGVDIIPVSDLRQVYDCLCLGRSASDHAKRHRC